MTNCKLLTTAMQEKKVKVAIGTGMIGIGAILLLSGFLNKIDHENCMAASRGSLDEFYGDQQSMETGTPICTPNISGFLFLGGSIVEATGIIVLILALMDISFISLSRAK